MKHSLYEPAVQPAPAAPPLLERRGMLLGTGVAAVVGIAAAVTARTLQPASPPPVAMAKPDDGADGYRLSPHVLRYYETTRV